MKFGNSFAELDHCTAGVCGLFRSRSGLALLGQLESRQSRTKIRQRQPFRLLWRVISLD
jgi:hypothetical protein